MGCRKFPWPSLRRGQLRNNRRAPGRIGVKYGRLNKIVVRNPENFVSTSNGFYPDFNPFTINERCFHYDFRHKSFHFKNDSDILVIDWEYCGEFSETSESLDREIARFLCDTTKAFHLSEPLKAIITTHSCNSQIIKRLDLEILNAETAKVINHIWIDEEKNTNNIIEPQNDFLKKGSQNDYYAPKELYKNENNLFETIQKNNVTYNKKCK